MLPSDEPICIVMCSPPYFRTAIPLLHALITSAQILNSTKLRQFVKKELVEMHVHVFRKHAQHATLLSLCIAQTLMMEASYSSIAPDEPLKDVWSRVLDGASVSFVPVSIK